MFILLPPGLAHEKDLQRRCGAFSPAAFGGSQDDHPLELIGSFLDHTSLCRSSSVIGADWSCGEDSERTPGRTFNAQLDRRFHGAAPGPSTMRDAQDVYGVDNSVLQRRHWEAAPRSWARWAQCRLRVQGRPSSWTWRECKGRKEPRGFPFRGSAGHVARTSYAPGSSGAFGQTIRVNHLAARNGFLKLAGLLQAVGGKIRP